MGNSCAGHQDPGAAGKSPETLRTVSSEKSNTAPVSAPHTHKAAGMAPSAGEGEGGEGSRLTAAAPRALGKHGIRQ